MEISTNITRSEGINTKEGESWRPPLEVFPPNLVNDLEPFVKGLHAYFTEAFSQTVEEPSMMVAPLGDDGVYDDPHHPTNGTTAKPSKPARDTSSDISHGESDGKEEGHPLTVHKKTHLILRNYFWRPDAPAITYHDYLERIKNSMPSLEPTILLAVAIYAGRLMAPEALEPRPDRQGFQLGANVIHRFTITAICLASKALGDQFYSNHFCALVGGITVKQLSVLELELAVRLDWSLQCSHEEYRRAWDLLCRHLGF